jgi:2-polyprenyl-6-methoxyphenol hydroxylase-like FAD-dependent oxidoreductase
VEAATEIRCVPLTQPPELENWVDPRGRVLLIGDSAHPFPVGTLLITPAGAHFLAA